MRMEEEVVLMETMSSEDSCYEADKEGKEALTSYQKAPLGEHSSAKKQRAAW